MAAAHSIGIAIFSYNETITFGVITDRESTPDIDVLVHGIQEGIEELLALVPNANHLALVIDGKTGFLVDDERAIAAAVGRLPSIAPRDCRAWVAEHCDIDAVTAAYERTYRSVAHPLGASVSRALLSAP